MKRSEFFREIIVFIFFIFSTGWYFAPLFKNFNSSLPDDKDSLFITWSINRMAQNSPDWPKKLMQGNIFYPHPHSHAYSDPFITAGLIAKPFLKINPEPAIAFNINLVLALFLTLCFTYLFLKQLVKDRKIALVLSSVFSFSLIHLHYLPHLHTFMIQLVPLSGFCLLKLRQRKKPVWLYAWTACFILQMLNSFLPGYFILVLTITFYFFAPDLQKTIKKNFKHLIVSFITIILILLPIINIYLEVSHYFNYVRPITEVIHFSLSPEEIITKFFSPSLYLVILLAIILFLVNKKNWQKKNFWFLILSIASLIVSLGPALHWGRKTIKIPFHIPLPYIFLYYLVPGFKGFRTPSRWILMAAFSAIAFAAVELKNIFKKTHQIKNLSLILILPFCLFTAQRLTSYVPIPQIKNYPPVYHWLKEQNKQVIIELPMNTWSGKEPRETYYMLYSLFHQKKLVNGYSGYHPEEYNQLVALLRDNFPNQETIDKLKKIKVDYLILHQEEKLSELNKLKGIKLIKSFNHDSIYEL